MNEHSQQAKLDHERREGEGEQGRQPRSRDQESHVGKMVELYRDKTGGKEAEAQSLWGRGVYGGGRGGEKWGTRQWEVFSETFSGFKI